MIAGGTNACQNVETGGGFADVDFLGPTLHAFFAGVHGTMVLDEVTLTASALFQACSCGGGGAVDFEVEVDASRGRAFVRRNCQTSDWTGSCVVVIQDGIFRDGFELNGSGRWSATTPRQAVSWH